jgi:hypothetical protein
LYRGFLVFRGQLDGDKGLKNKELRRRLFGQRVPKKKS